MWSISDFLYQRGKPFRASNIIKYFALCCSISATISADVDKG